jgi:alpha-beta hydrolase superfamily lysophospholipase
MSIFDRPAFNESLFYPRRDVSPPGAAADHHVDVGGARVHLRVHPAAGARCRLLLFHGNGEVVADYDAAVTAFAQAGAALAVADFRGYGASTGSPTLHSVIADARAVASAMPADLPLVVMGRSLGGMAAHELYAHPLATMIGVVLESTLYDLAGLIRRRGLEVPRGGLTAEERARYEPAGKLAAGTLPLLVLHGADDTLIPAREAIAAHAAAGSADKELVLVPDRGHNDVSYSRVYWDALAAFVARIA